ncbi:chloramphenicol phosphotransferase CPT family protein [Deinococcus hohokamensis]|uniref:Chloramphenicol phosphotransferase CPT family protein n=1 Tax=Deinococcus hohokamensis TaxID=309883 RepID=A0ABV9I6Q7_9DEIO
MSVGTLVILNGTTSAGKSSVQRALMDLADEPWLAAGVDHFWRFIFGKYNGLTPPADQGFHWIGRFEGDTLYVDDLRTGPVGDRFFTGMHHAIRAFLNAGLNVVADHCLWDQRLVEQCAAVFSDVDAWMVGLHPPLEVSETWERQRTDKQILGMSRAVQRLMDGTQVEYDLTFDTSRFSPQACATEILQAVQGRPPEALRRMAASGDTASRTGAPG